MAGTRRLMKRRPASFAISTLAFLLLPTQIGFQDLGALIAQQPGVSARWRAHVIASPFGTIHASMFSMPHPIGTAIPHPPLYALANFDPNDLAGSIGSQTLGDGSAPLQFPSVNRKAKHDALMPRKRKPLPPIKVLPPVDAQAPADFIVGDRDNFEARIEPLPQVEAAPAPATEPDLPYTDLPPADIAKAAPTPGEGGNSAQLYFGVDPLSSLREAIAPWEPGEAPVVMMPAAPGEFDIKESALSTPSEATKSGESVANKGEVTGVDKRPLSPAERLSLTGAARAKSEKCLANAVYFEARGEPVRGQIAVAQVVMNRVFSPFYPKTVCDVVYQNANRHNACQFTFACDGIPDIVTEPDAWERAKHIAKDMLDGKLWMPEVAKSTHYHAYWVHPSWVAEMKRMYKLGVHTFYRPRAWGDGSDEAHWGDPKLTAEEAKKL
jgi:spore germination cell wall hydrolase CwlJ-like protein